MLPRIIKYLLVCCCLTAGLPAIGQNPGNKSDTGFIKGIYGNPATLLKQGHTFQSMGVNAIFVRSVSLNETLYTTAKDAGVKVFVEFPTLNGKEYLTGHPEAWPVNEKGHKEPPADWFMGICPTDPGFRQWREEELAAILRKYDVDGVWLDYLHWHAQFETPEPILPETCFCDRCTGQFEMAAKIAIPPGDIPSKAKWILAEADPQWREWRSGVLNNWVAGLKKIVKERNPDALLGIYYCSWYPADYDSALYRIMGLDLEALAGIADVFSPMLYHQRKGRSVSWVGEYTAWLGGQPGFSGTKPPLIWPIVQANNIPNVVTADEFRQVMIKGSQPPATGIMMFSEQGLVQDPAKLGVMKELYKQK